MHTTIFSATTIGVTAHHVRVEVDLSFGLVSFYIVGLPDAAIRESSKRITAALKNSGIRLPARRITVNLAPADLKKEGTLFDLPIAIGLLQASGQLELSQSFLEETLFIGELSLDGGIRFIKGALAIAYDAHKLGKKRIILPKHNAQEAALLSGLEIIGVETLVELVTHLRNEVVVAPTRNSYSDFVQNNEGHTVDFADVKGQMLAKRALQISAAGRHNTLFIGPPGSGKTMLARRLPTIMPPMTFEEVIATSKIYSITGKLNNKPLITTRQFRSPHHTISQAGLVGGGSFPQPGEISLAHNGILFLDELTEFKRTTLEALRQPLENKVVSISRAQYSATFPASFLLIAALNPCPCGFYGDAKRACICTQQRVDKYLDKLSGPLLDRIDLQVAVKSVEYETVTAHAEQQTSASLLEQVNHAVYIQQQRNNGTWNGHLSARDVEQYCTLTLQAEQTIKKAFTVLKLSMRGYHKLLKVARTIADMAQSTDIDIPHIQEAITYRSLDTYLEKNRK